MNEFIAEILERKLSGACPEISISVPITLHVSINGAHHCESPYVEFTIFVKKWLLNVLLDDIGSLVSIDVGVLNQAFYVIQLF